MWGEAPLEPEDVYEIFALYIENRYVYVCICMCVMSPALLTHTNLPPLPFPVQNSYFALV